MGYARRKRTSNNYSLYSGRYYKYGHNAVGGKRYRGKGLWGKGNF